MRQRIRHPIRRQPPGKKINCSSLTNPAVRETLATEVTSKLLLPRVSDGSTSIKDGWNNMAEVMRSSAEAVLGCTTRKSRDSFDDNAEEIKLLLNQKNRAHAAYIGNPASVFLGENGENCVLWSRGGCR